MISLYNALAKINMKIVKNYFKNYCRDYAQIRTQK